MASHHHLHHQPAAGYFHCCYAACTPYYHHPDSHHLLNPPPPPPQLHIYSAQAHVPNLHQHQNRHPHFQEPFFQEERQTHPTISSLLHRITALEFALSRRSSSTHSLRDAAALTIQTHFRAFLSRRSRTLRQLKYLASIKSDLKILKLSVSENAPFNYDVIYHKALGLLHKLDTIQGGDPMIRDGKSSIRKDINVLMDSIDGICVRKRGVLSGVNLRSNVKSRFANSERRMGTERRGDPKRVNVGKPRGLVQRIDKLTEVLDEEESGVIENSNVSIRKHGVSGKRTGGLVKQHGGVQSKMTKSVSFVENGKVYRVLKRNCEPFLDEDCDNSINKDNVVGAEGGELEDAHCREVQEIGVYLKGGEDADDSEAQTENRGSLLSSDGERDSRSYLRSEGNSERTRRDLEETNDFAFSALWPLKMEARAELTERNHFLSKMKGGKSKADSRKADSRLAAKKQTEKENRAAKDLNKPKRPLSAFFIFMEGFRKQYNEEHPDNESVDAVGKACGDKWKSMSEEEKAPFVAKAKKEKEEYEKKMEAYNKKLLGGGDGDSDKSKSEFNDEDEGSGEDDEDDD